MGSKVQAAAYIRVSTDDQLEYSPESQLKLIKQFALKHNMALKPEHIYRDDGVSGRTAGKRPGFLKMIAAAKEKPAPFSCLLVWKFSRFARNQEESVVYKSLLKRECGVEVVSVSEPLMEGPFGSLIERIIEWTDDYYSVRLSGEVVRGMAEKASRGEPVSIPAFGYEIKENRYLPKPEESPYVRMIFEDFIDGCGLREIAMKLNAMGVKTHRGNAFENRNIEYILKNPVYLGKIRWSPPANPGGGAAGHTEKILADGRHQPLVSLKTWNLAQEELQRRKRQYQKYARRDSPAAPFMLQGLVRCSCCGSTLCMASSGSLQCCSYSRGGCRQSHSIAVPKLNALFLSGLKAVFCNGDLPDIKRKSPSGLHRENLNRLIQREKARLSRIQAAYETGADTLEEYRQHKQKIEASIRLLKKRQAEAAVPAASAESKTNLFSYLNAPEVPEEDKNRCLRSFVDHLTFSRQDNTLEIILY